MSAAEAGGTEEPWRADWRSWLRERGTYYPTHADSESFAAGWQARAQASAAPHPARRERKAILSILAEIEWEPVTRMEFVTRKGVTRPSYARKPFDAICHLCHGYRSVGHKDACAIVRIRALAADEEATGG